MMNKKTLLSCVALLGLLTACSTTTDKYIGEGEAAMGEYKGPVPGSYEHFQKFTTDRVMFGFDKSSLTDEGRQILDKQAEWLNEYPSVDLLIEGHCDKRGTREYNLALGERRAKAAFDYLVSKGIDPERLRIVSYGKERPVVEGDTEEAYAKNRVAISVVQ